MHKATTRFWRQFEHLPRQVQNLATRNFKLLKEDPMHPSLHFKRVGAFWSVRVGINHRALAIKEGDDFIWVWIGSHAEYEQMLSGRS